MKEIKRQIAIGDIHGCYGLMVDLLEDVIRFDPDTDELVFIGDYIDRGDKSMHVVTYVNALRNKYPESIVLLMGNHELLAHSAFKTRGSNHVQLWFINGGINTINSYGNYENAQKHLVPFIDTLRYYYETPSHIFVHGGIPMGETLQSAQPNALLWDRNYDRYRGKTIIVGHTPHKVVTKYKSAVAIDTGAVYTGKLSAYDPINDCVYEAVDLDNRKSAK
ncbi:metallophosphoesterase family protein [Candidatus Magnetobacterium casense]|uniref:Serine/threonine protein phosphatase n=1 Tax=Candidatus Magnetobacterium casense TaxID=1455061 RepID=A0ABS6RY36_9BACT|nr:metallophosphoesterase family protein [Candidatus Magnetobacterium casensis]MBV6341565.1 serine/threonine protein phosphatase [Candidatus Magnetobacterium casensis]